MITIRNTFGREIDLSDEDYARLKAKGFKMQVVSREIKPVVKTDSIMYTAICGDYPYKRKDIKCFGCENIFQRPVMEAKRYKVLPHQFFQNQYRIWIDANITYKESNDYAIARFLNGKDLAIFKHPYRNTVWQEFETLQKDKRFKDKWLQKNLKEQMAFYKSQGLPDNTPLWECNFMISRNTESINRVFDAWWAEICRWQWRDQVSLPYVLWKYKVNMNTIEEGNIRNHKLFKYQDHYAK